jgi:hypothetical protein
MNIDTAALPVKATWMNIIFIFVAILSHFAKFFRFFQRNILVFFVEYLLAQALKSAGCRIFRKVPKAPSKEANADRKETYGRLSANLC